VNYVFEFFGEDISVSWVDSLVKRHANKLETVDAFPIEREKTQVTFEELETYCKKLEVFFKTIHNKNIKISE
jgi:hypothetical protein